jgi:hypothetical protein
MKYQLEDYNVTESGNPLYCDNAVAIHLPKNPIDYVQKAYKHHFI